MPKVVKIVGDITLGSVESAPPTTPAPYGGGVGNVFVQNSKIVLIGDEFMPHQITGATELHTPKALTGAMTVFVNGKLVHRVKDFLTCLDYVFEGTSNVFVEGP